MTTKRKKRIPPSKNLIHDALISMLKKQHLHDITVQTLCDTAGINRTTFYNHYGNIYDVWMEIVNHYFEGLSLTITSSANSESYNHTILFYEYIEQHLELSKLVFQNDYDSHTVQVYFNLPKVQSTFRESLSHRENHEYDDYIIDFVSYGTYKLVQRWLSEKPRRSILEIAKIHNELAAAVCNWEFHK